MFKKDLQFLSLPRLSRCQTRSEEEREMKCEIRGCGNVQIKLLRVNEHIGDGCFSAEICERCLRELGIDEGECLPELEVVEKMINNRRELLGIKAYKRGSP